MMHAEHCSMDEEGVSNIRTDHTNQMRELTDNEINSMTFTTEDEAYDFYKKFSYKSGFGVRLGDRKCNTKGIPIFRVFKCSCAGLREAKYLNRSVSSRKKQNITRCECLAKLRIGLDKETNRWEVREFVREHTHPLICESMVHLHRSHRHMSDADKLNASSLRQCGVNSAQVFSLLAEQRGGYDNVGFTEKDLYNQSAADRRESFKDGDAEAVLGYLSGKTIHDPSSMYRYTTDEENRLQHLFWVDSGCILDYQFYNDIVCFDSTYKTNCYEKPFVIFVGTNCHRNTVLFGCALLGNEREDAYIWLLKVFLECHENKIPKCVITDGDVAMRKAVKEVFVGVRHRLCSWHLDQNVMHNIKDALFLDRYRELAQLNCTRDEFDVAWVKLLDDFNVDKEMVWVTDMYAKRSLWAYSYLRGHFFAGMSTTQRSEGINSYVKKFASEHMKMCDLIDRFDRAMVAWRQKYYQQEYIARYTVPVLRTHLPSLERHACDLFTPTNLETIVSMIRREKEYFVKDRRESECGTETTYMVQRYTTKNSYRIVEYRKVEQLFRCSCMHFEEHGLPCTHIFVVLKAEHFEFIPNSCILERWTKNATTELVFVGSHPIGREKECKIRYAALTSICNRMCYNASQDQQLFSTVRDELTKLNDVVEHARCASSTSARVEDYTQNNPTDPVVRDPELTRAKGSRPLGQDGRKSGKQRRCSECKELGHKITTCPQRRNPSSQPESERDFNFGEATTSHNLHYDPVRGACEYVP